MSESTFKWTCIKCNNDIPQHKEYCAECEEKRYRKIGGWLYLPLVNVFVLGFMYVMAMVQTLKVGLQTLGHISLLSNVYLFFAALVNFILFLSCIYILPFFIRKKKELPSLYVFLIVGGLFILILDRVAVYFIFPQVPRDYDFIKPVIQHLIFCCVWVAYFRTSLRVKNTFVR